MEKDMQSVCRLCLNESDMKINADANKDLNAEIKTQFGIKISTDDKCTKQICLECYNTVTNYTIFKKKVIANQIILKAYESNTSSVIKVELTEDEIKSEVIPPQVNESESVTEIIDDFSEISSDIKIEETQITEAEDLAELAENLNEVSDPEMDPEDEDEEDEDDPDMDPDDPDYSGDDVHSMSEEEDSESAASSNSQDGSESQTADASVQNGKEKRRRSDVQSKKSVQIKKSRKTIKVQENEISNSSNLSDSQNIKDGNKLFSEEGSEDDSNALPCPDSSSTSRCFTLIVSKMEPSNMLKYKLTTTTDPSLEISINDLSPSEIAKLKSSFVDNEEKWKYFQSIYDLNQVDDKFKELIDILKEV